MKYRLTVGYRGEIVLCILLHTFTIINCCYHLSPHMYSICYGSPNATNERLTSDILRIPTPPNQPTPAFVNWTVDRRPSIMPRMVRGQLPISHNPKYHYWLRNLPSLLECICSQSSHVCIVPESDIGNIMHMLSTKLLLATLHNPSLWNGNCCIESARVF